VWQFNDNPPAIERAEEWHDKTDVTTKALLDLLSLRTLPRPKYDPIAQKDYYRIASVFASTSYKAYPQVRRISSTNTNPKRSSLTKRQAAEGVPGSAFGTYGAGAVFTDRAVYGGGMEVWIEEGEHDRGHCGAGEAGPGDSDAVGGLFEEEADELFVPDRLAKDEASGGSVDEAATLANKFYLKAVEVDKQHTKIKEEDQASACDAQDGPGTVRFDAERH